MHLAAGEATLWAMTDDKVKRRLTTVLCADVHGYSRLMEADEAGTLRTLRRYRTAIAGLVERHDGRIVNTWGDAVIAEFASVVEAVQCAVEIQQEISNQDSDPPDAQRMRFRIGINLGDVYKRQAILASWDQMRRQRWGRCAATALPLQGWWSAMTGGS